MARYNTVSTTSSVSGGNVITTPSSGLLTTLTGTGTVTVPNPVYYTGQTQTFYNSTGSAITLATPSGIFNGPGSGASSNLSLPAGSIITVVSDGTNYIVESWLGGAIVVSGTLTAYGTVAMNPSNANVSIQPTGTGTLNMSSGATGSLDNVSIGTTTQASGKFTTLSSTGVTQVTAGTSVTLGTAASGALQVTGGVGIGGGITVGSSGYFGGSVGIGITNPSYPLVVSNSGAQGIEFSPTGGINSGGFIQAYNRSGAAYLDLTYYATQYHFWTNGNEKFTLDSSGNLSISNKASSPTNSQNPPGSLYFYGQGWNTLSGSTQYQGQISLGGAYSASTGSVEPAITFSLAGTGNSGYNASAGPSTLTERVRINNYGNIGVGTTTPQVTLDMGSRTDAILLPSGTSAQRPSAVAGMMRYNSTSGTAEVYSQGSWNAFGTVANGLTATTPFTKSSDMVNQSSNGTYWIQTKNMTSAQQYYVDYTSTTGGPWVRIFLANTDNYNQTSYSWDNAQSSNMLLDSAYFMYAFVNSSTNALTYPWAFRFNDSTTLNGSSDGNKSAFLSGPPMGHGGSGSPLITYMYTIRLTDSTVYSGYLRTGVSSFGSLCDDGRSGIWGQICLKAGGSGGSGTGSGGYSDFPHFSSFAYSGTDNWAQSNQSYTTNSSDSNHRFGVYCKLV